MTQNDISINDTAPSIEVQSLSYAFSDGSPGLQDVNLSLPPGSRTLLIGGNGTSALSIIFHRTGPDIETKQMELARRHFFDSSLANALHPPVQSA